MKLNIDLKSERPDNPSPGLVHELRTLSWVEFGILAAAVLVSLYILFGLPVHSN